MQDKKLIAHKKHGKTISTILPTSVKNYLINYVPQGNKENLQT